MDALHGAAANLVGDITPGSIYAHIDQSLGPWAQRPVFKTNVKTFVSLRKADPPIALSDLQSLPRLFPSSDFEFQLDPSYEPQRSSDELNNPRRRPQCAPSQNIVRYRENSLTALILFIPATAKPQISNETARIILLRSDLKYPLKAANFAVIYCFITPTQKGLPKQKLPTAVTELSAVCF